jgi:hypothetical protein
MPSNYISVTPNFIKIRAGGIPTERCGPMDRQDHPFCIAATELHTNDTQEWILRTYFVNIY